MAGPAWTTTEMKILLYSLCNGVKHETIRMKLAEEVPEYSRTLPSIRSKSADLQKDPAIYDSTTKEWIREGVESLISRLPSDEESSE
jgi:hypothetical protein